jgi:hypothetical protein
MQNAFPERIQIFQKPLEGKNETFILGRIYQADTVGKKGSNDEAQSKQENIC